MSGASTQPRVYSSLIGWRVRLIMGTSVELSTDELSAASFVCHSVARV